MSRKRRKPSQYNLGAEKRFHKELQKLADVIGDIIRENKEPPAIVNALSLLAESPEFNQWATRRAYQMSRSVLVSNAATWREAARKGTNSERIFEILSKDFSGRKDFNEIVLRNAQWIKTLPVSTGQQITAMASREAIRGKRYGDIVEEIQRKAPDIPKYKATRIARTEVAKTNAAMTKLRADDAGVGWYIWHTVNDNRVRSSHDFMEGILCQFNNPPSPEMLAKDGNKNAASYYNPGGIYNCRCYAEPLVVLDQVSWPAKVVRNGQIVRMSKANFKKVSGL